MIRVKMLLKHEVAVIDNGKVYLFDSGGRCYSEKLGLLPQYTNGMQDLPIISVLSASNRQEILVVDNDNNVRKFEVEIDKGLDAGLFIAGNSGFIRVLTRKGEQDGIRFSQMIFIYPKGTDLNSKIAGLKLKEIK